MLTPEERRRAIEIARGAIGRALGPAPPADPSLPLRSESLPPVFDERRGVFVTLKQLPSDDLRGCIGYALPVLPLRVGLPRAAVAAALEDPRFPSVRPTELPRLRVEVSVLTVPVDLDGTAPEARRREVRVGRDGLIVDGFGQSGLLLPQVGPEQGWSAEELLEGTCEKAGLRRDAWQRPEVRVRRFEAEVFGESADGERPLPETAAPTEPAGRAAPKH